jgi:hypothetical protein
VSVWAGLLPFDVQHHGKTIFRVDQFLPDGFVITGQSPGLAIEAEVSYSEVVPFSPPGALAQCRNTSKPP